MWPPLNRVGAEFIGVTRKERPCFAAERGLDRLGHTTLRMVYWRHTKGTALFCCRTRPRPHQIGLGQSLLEPHEKNGPVLLQNVASTALGTQASGRFIGGTRKERRSFAAERGPDPFGHTRALEGPFFDPNPRARSQAVQFGIRKSRPDFATSNSFRKMCILLWAGGRSRGGPFPKMWPPLNRVGAEFIGATRKERPCFAAERGLDRLGHTSLRMVYWRHTKGTALFCCRTRPRPL